MDELFPMTDELRQGWTAGGSAPRAQPNPALLLWRLLRGRVVLAIGVGLVLAVPLAVVAYSLVPVRYTSTGIVRVAPTLPRVMYKSDENGTLPLFDSFASAQASYLSSRRVLDKAVADPALREAGWRAPPQGLDDLSKALEVNHRGGTELITATVRYRNPLLAQKAVNAVLSAYEAIQKDLGGLTVTDREQTLDKIKSDQQIELDLMRGHLTELITPYGTDDLDQLHAAKVGEMVKLDSLIADLDHQLVEVSGVAGAGSAGPPERALLSAESLARNDRLLAHLLESDVALRLEIQRLSAKVKPDHHQMSNLLRELETSTKAIDGRLAELRADPKMDASAPADQTVDGVASLRAKREQYVQMRETLSASTMSMGRTRLSIAVLKDRMAEVKARLDEFSRELEQIRVENHSPSVGRVSIVQMGDLPFGPSTDRRITAACAAFMGGIGIGTGLVVLLGSMRTGYRYIDELEDRGVPAMLLGIVPQLGTGAPELENQAQLSVHHLRHMLQAQDQPDRSSRAIAITSAAAGDGKTSIAYALGVSFAANGDRTIIVDADLVGSGLTRRLGLTGAGGLCEAVRRDELNGEVHSTSVSNLWALPVGADQSLDPSQLSAGLMAPLLDRLRKNFDVVIIDTGPILGSLEANLLARLADRVLMVVSRGQSPKSVRAALQQVHRLGATCAGLVFNRAMAQDFEHSTSAGSLRSRASRPDPSWSKASIDGRPLMFAPNALVDVKGAHAPSEQTGAP
jgi:Mrp family chromosome partitioning ATPase/uncharacterized protein involved in exopolysaccharide biosynthesis